MQTSPLINVYKLPTHVAGLAYSLNLDIHVVGRAVFECATEPNSDLGDITKILDISKRNPSINESLVMRWIDCAVIIMREDLVQSSTPDGQLEPVVRDAKYISVGNDSYAVISTMRDVRLVVNAALEMVRDGIYYQADIPEQIYYSLHNRDIPELYSEFEPLLAAALNRTLYKPPKHFADIPAAVTALSCVRAALEHDLRDAIGLLANRPELHWSYVLLGDHLFELGITATPF